MLAPQIEWTISSMYPGATRDAIGSIERTSVVVTPGDVERVHGDSQKAGQTLMGGAEFVGPQHQQPFRRNRPDAGVDMPVPRMQVGRYREQATVREDAVGGSVRIPVRLEPPLQELGHVRGHVADGEMARDRLQPRVAVSNQHDESHRGKDVHQVPDEELVCPCHVVFQVEPGIPHPKVLPDGRVREFTVRVSEDQVERCRPLGFMGHTVVGGQQSCYRGSARFRLADAERLHARGAGRQGPLGHFNGYAPTTSSSSSTLIS